MKAGAASARRTPADLTHGDAAALKKLARRAGDATRLLKLLANEKRLLILCHLASGGEIRVGDLTEQVGLSQSALSQHLAKLRADGLVAFRRASQTLFYRLAKRRAMRLLPVLREITAAI